jgi:adiponectin receptor
VVKLSLSSSSSEENLLEEETEILDSNTTMKESKTECCAHSKDQSTTAGASETKGTIKMKTNLSEYELCDYREAPAYIVQPYILSGYRANFSVKLCLYSLFRIHNESGNVLTHLFAALYYLWLLFKMYFIGDELDEAYHMHGLHYSLAAFYIACIYCFTASAMFHLFNSHSRDMCCNLLRADFSGTILIPLLVFVNFPELISVFITFPISGIVVLTTASYIPPLYAGFACFPTIRWFYLITVCSIGLIAAVVLLSPSK